MRNYAVLEGNEEALAGELELGMRMVLLELGVIAYYICKYIEEIKIAYGC